MAGKRILVPLAEGCEELEAITITDLLTRAGFDVITAGLDDKPVVASRGMTLLPKTTMSDIMDEDFDLIVLPGGLPGADHLRDDANVQKKIKLMSEQDKYVAAICAAPKALASAGVLDNKKATSYPGALDGVDITGLDFRSDAVVIDNRVITSRGPGTAMDFALTLIELLAGADKKQEVEGPLLRT